ncbi:hypothetical protein ACFPM7_29180 [Actinokineospora guangxiensis]|uniref:Type VII secretion system (Wss) protein ESAT-6 n=1 Tax=Actinokineospora guangxiensis TaxID=1490288 RepID=A0ABW0EUV9_9PSEU
MAATEYDKEAIEAAANKLGTLLDDMDDFNELKPHWPNAGKFPLAQWLERIVDDRRNAIVAHAEHLRLTLESSQTSLLQIAEDFDNLDGGNAEKIKGVLDKLTTRIQGEWDTWDSNTEKDHRNYTPRGDGNATDGDGYNDDLNDPLKY